MTASSVISAILRRKKSTLATSTISSAPVGEKVLNLFDLILLGVGGTLGSGLFLLSGHAARYISGPAITLSFLVAAIACLFSALSYAEMSSRYPNSGGAYAFTYASLGELPAFLVGMCLTLEYGVSSAAVARSWASYLGDSLGFLPSWATGIGSQVSVLGFLLVLAVSVLLAVGLKEAKWVINIATLMYATVVLVIIAFGSQKVDTSNWNPYLPFGWHGIIAGSSAVFFAYIGFDEIACVSEEAYNSSTTVPLAILLSMLIVSALYVAASMVLTGMVNYTDINVDAPFSAAFRNTGLPLIARLVGFGTALGMMNTTIVSLAAQPRIFMSMGRDGLLPRSFAFSTRIATIGCGFLVSIMAIIVETQSLADLVSGGTLLAFLATNISLLLTRCRIHPDSKKVSSLIYIFVAGCAITGIMSRIAANGSISNVISLGISIPVCLIPAAFVMTQEFSAGELWERTAPSFLCPLVPIMPLLGAFTTTFLLFQLSPKALGALGLWLVISSAGYFSYGFRNALIAHEYATLGDDSPDHSYNSFDNIAMEANSIDSEELDDDIPQEPPIVEGQS